MAVPLTEGTAATCFEARALSAPLPTSGTVVLDAAGASGGHALGVSGLGFAGEVGEIASTALAGC